MTDLQADLLAWWAENGRDLPWRRSRDPWAILVSETMLQQTQVARVIDRWQRFLDRFPDVSACASAARAQVIEEWAGLGYNRRAAFLHRAAQECVSRFGGALPTTVPELQTLPGIGPYTARAVMVFAHEADIGLVDTNAGRFVARAVAGRSVKSREAQSLADLTVPEGWGWTWGQAVFDLGATICTKRSPRCKECPIAGSCAWALAGHAEPDPVVGSAGISAPQSRFDGSDRQGRGRLVDRLRRAEVDDADLDVVMGWPGDRERAERVARSLIHDGLVVCVDNRWALRD